MTGAPVRAEAHMDHGIDATDCAATAREPVCGDPRELPDLARCESR